ncbi:MAG TPA: thiamine pyrophosphate-binding protein, partial [Gemmatimonadaceae bacterium]|nr:thiamine pyrophosphate-binding protein [Gemmatimonadaceae bacterium]
FAITHAAHAASVIREAHALATGGEPGPVMVELDMTALRADAGAEAATPMAAPAPPAHDAASDELAMQFSRSKRPLFLVGQGAYSVAARLHTLVERLFVPVMTTPSARGVVAEDHPLVLPFDPLRGHTDVANQFIDRADLVVALGCKLGHNGTAGFSLRLPSDRLVHVDIEPGTVGANYETLLGLTASVESVLPALEARSARTEWVDADVAHARATLRSPSADQAEPVIHGGWSRTPRELFDWLRRVLSRDAIVVTDSGLHQILARRHFDVLAPRGLICPTDYQSMGFGLPAAIGAKIAAPDRQVVAVVGDGGFLMSGLELLTARREKVPIAVFVFNDGHLNQIRVQQQSGSGRTQAVDLFNPDYEMLAKSFDIRYLRLGAGDAESAAKALDRNGDGPVLIEVLVGDSMEMRAAAAVALSKAVVRRALGPRLAASLRRWLRR